MMKGYSMNKLLCLGIVICLASPSLLVAVTWGIGEKIDDQTGSIRTREDTYEKGRENNELTFEEPNLEDEENEVSNHIANEFEWKHHRDDHGIYSGRSLISTEDIKPKQDHSEAEDGYVEDIETGSLVRESLLKGVEEKDEPDPLKTVDYAEKEWQLMFRSLDLVYESMASSILSEIARQTNLFSDIISRLDPKCQRDIYYIRDSLKKHKLWALRMIDSHGKIPSGITYGRFSSPGDYEECLSVRVDDNLYTDIKNNIIERHKFHGKYCLIDFRLPLPERPKNKLLSVHESVLNFTGTDIERMFPDMVKNYSAYASVFYEVGYLHAFCLPSTCNILDITKSVGKALEGMYVIVNNTVDCEERFEDAPPFRKSQWIAIVLLLLIFLNAFIASVAYKLLPKGIRQPPQTDQRRGSMKAPPLEVIKQAAGEVSKAGANNNGQQDTQDKINRLNLLREAKRLSIVQNKSAGLKRLMVGLAMRHKFYADCFSVQKNFERLNKPDPRGLTFVHYTRIVAMALTVITHTGALGTLQAITKPADASNSESIFRDLLPQMLANAFTSIQIFFFMAGFMLVISTYPSIERDKGHLSFVEYAIKRAIRLMPGLAATICLNFVWPLMVDGPMLKYFDRAIVEPCEKNWWHTMFFMSNFDHVEKMCLRHSYFSASDYQLHIIAFPLLVLLYKRPILALFLAAIFTVSGFVAQVIMILTKTVLPFMMVDYIDKEAFFNVVHYMHHPVWNHMSSFFYGFIIGYLVVKQIRINLSSVAIKRIWLVMAPIGVASIFAPYFWNHYKRPIYRWQMVLYVIFDRFILLSACAWLSYAVMVLARKPAPRKQLQAAKSLQEQPVKLQADPIKSPIEQVLTKDRPKTFASFDNQQHSTGVSNTPQDNLSLCSQTLPRQRSSPNLNYLQQLQQQQLQQQQLNQPDLGRTLNPLAGRLNRTVSTSNLNTIAEVNQSDKLVDKSKSTPDKAFQAPAYEHSTPKPQRSRAPVSNMNILCLVLSRLTFQLYLFNMVVLCVDVNHSKYYWYFSYYFIIIKSASVYIISAVMAMIFFVVLESPSLTLYIAWVRSRAAKRARRSKHTSGNGGTKFGADVNMPVPPPIVSISIGEDKTTSITSTTGGHASQSIIHPISSESVEMVATTTTVTTKPTFTFVDLSSSAVSAKNTGQPTEANTATSKALDQTSM